MTANQEATLLTLDCPRSYWWNTSRTAWFLRLLLVQGICVLSAPQSRSVAALSIFCSFTAGVAWLFSWLVRSRKQQRYRRVLKAVPQGFTTLQGISCCCSALPSLECKQSRCPFCQIRIDWFSLKQCTIQQLLYQGCSLSVSRSVRWTLSLSLQAENEGNYRRCRLP